MDTTDYRLIVSTSDAAIHDWDRTRIAAALVFRETAIDTAGSDLLERNQRWKRRR